MSETKAEKFSRLSVPRQEKALDALRILGHLSRKATYDYTTDQARALLAPIEKLLADLRNEFGLAQIEPTPEPETAKANFKAGKLDHRTACWAYEMLTRGQTEDAKIMLKRALQGGVDGTV